MELVRAVARLVALVAGLVWSLSVRVARSYEPRSCIAVLMLPGE